MDCHAFDRWLDQNRPASFRTEADGHAGICPRCSSAREAAEALQHVLAQRFATTPDDFTERVMERIEARLPPAVVPSVEPSFPWWLQALQEPAVILASMLTFSLIAWRRPLAATVQGAFMSIGEASAELATTWSSDPTTLFLVTIGAVPLLAVGSWALYRLSIAWGAAPQG